MRAYDYIADLAAVGRYCFTSRDAREALEVSADATKLALGRLARKKRIASPARGFHVILAPEYRSLGCLPAEQFVPELMQWLNQPYYAGLLSAAQFHGAAHHRPQEFQVMLIKPRRPLRCGQVRVAFIGRKRLHDVPVQSINTPRGTLQVSTPEATAVDLVGFQRRAGGLDQVATVLSELAELMDTYKLLAAAETAPVTWAQRLGYLLESVDAGKLVAPLKEYVRINARRTTALLPGATDRESHRAADWKLRINAHISIDGKIGNVVKSTHSPLPYQMGNAGDLLKHGVLAEFLRWRCSEGTSVRFLDLFGGEPFDDGVPDEIVRRVAALEDTSLYELQSEISTHRYYGSGKLALRLGELEQGNLVSVYVADRDSQRRIRLRESGLRMLTEAFPEVVSGSKPYDAYVALSRIVRYTRTGDLVLIDPFKRFLSDKAPSVIPQMAKIARTGSVMLFALNLDPFNAVGRRFDLLLERHLGGALIMTVPPIRGSSIEGESRHYVDIILAGREIGCDRSGTTKFRRRLDDFSLKLATALGLSSRAAWMLRPRVIGDFFNGNPANHGRGARNGDKAHSEPASKTDPPGQVRRPGRHASDHLTHTAYGVDGCREGWFYVELKPSGDIRWGVVKKVEELVSSTNDQARIFIDIPIGLPDDGEDRTCDRAARKALGRPRASSVFPAPARAVLDLDARTYQESNEFSRKTVGKGITRQTYAILPKIREVDTFLRSSAKARSLIREVHPELCFWALNGENPMRFNKSKPEGFWERLDVVKGQMSTAAAEVRQMIRWSNGRGVARDDILDSLVAAITASQPQEAWQTVPACATNDRFGLPMEMVYVTHERLRETENQ